MIRELWAQLEIFEGGAVKRFHTHPIIGQQTVAEHSWGVAAIISWLYPDASADLLRYAIHHDVAEIDTGDIPFSVKRTHPEIKQILEKIEDHHAAYLSLATVFSDEDHRRLKVADYLECLIFCIQQKRLGSRTMDPVVNNLRKALQTLVNSTVELQAMNEIVAHYQVFPGESHD